MADEEVVEAVGTGEGQEGTEKAPKDKAATLILMMTITSVILFVSTPIVTWLIIKAATRSVSTKTTNKSQDENIKSGFVKIEGIQCNLSGGGSSFIKFDVFIKLNDRRAKVFFGKPAEDGGEVKEEDKRIDQIRSRIIEIVSDEKKATITTKEGKETLQTKLRNGINTLLEKDFEKAQIDAGCVSEIMFPSIIVQ